MDSLEIFELLSLYGIDSALMAAAAAAITVTLNRLLFSKLNLSDKAKRAVKLLPYALGILFYAIYSLACGNDISCFFGKLAEIVKQGLAVGTLGFLLSIAAGKILDGKKAKVSDAEAVAALIEAYICPDELHTAATLLCAAAKEKNKNEAKKLLGDYAAEGVTEEQTELIAQLIFTYFELT